MREGKKADFIMHDHIMGSLGQIGQFGTTLSPRTIYVSVVITIAGTTHVEFT